MAMQETSLHDRDVAPETESTSAAPRVSLVVDRPTPTGRALLLLPFAAAEREEPLGRQICLVLQRRLHAVPDLVVGHGVLIVTSAGTRRYLPLAHEISPESALACGASWGASAVLYGSITLQPALRWSLTLRDVAEGTVLFEDTLIGDAEDLPGAPWSVAHEVAQALGCELHEAQLETPDGRETEQVEALLAYLRAMDVRPQHGLTTADPEAMRRDLLRAVALDHTFLAPADLLIADLDAAKDDARAVDALIAAMESLGSEGVEGLVRVASLADERGNSRQAEQLISAVLEAAPLHATALDLAAHLAFRAGQFARARTLVQTLLDLEPESARAHELLGNLLAAVGRYPGAAQHWEIALEQSPDRPKLLMRLGTYLAVAGEYQRAYQLLRQAATHETVTGDALYKLGVSAYRLGLIDEGVVALQQALQRNPRRAQAHALLARCYDRVGNRELTLAHDGRAVDLKPSLWPSMLALASAALHDGQLVRALAGFTQVARVRPDLPDALYGLGKALVANGMLDDGVVVLRRALELSPRDTSILCALARAYAQAGNMAAAARMLAVAEEQAPDSVLVGQCRAVLQRIASGS